MHATPDFAPRRARPRPETLARALALALVLLGSACLGTDPTGDGGEADAGDDAEVAADATDPGFPDATARDAFVRDADPAPDAEAHDAFALDASLDSGLPDSGRPDSGRPDGGRDGGRPDSGLPPPRAPTRVNATPGDQSVMITWHAAGATSNYIYWSTHADLTPATGSRTSTVTSGVVVDGLTNGVTYYFIVTSMGPGGESAPSAVASANPRSGEAPEIVAYAPLDAETGVPVGVEPFIEVLTPMDAASMSRAFTVRTATASVPGRVVYDGYRATFVPTRRLSFATQYFAQTSSAATDILGNPLASAVAWSFTTQDGPPPTLGALVGNRAATLSWAAVPGATTYLLQRATGASGPYTAVAETDGLSFTDSGLTNGTSYRYTISSLRQDDLSAPSAELTVVPSALAPTIPTGLSAAPTNGQVTLEWSAVSGATSYSVYAAGVAGGPHALVQSGVQGTAFTERNLTNGVARYYVVRAVNSNGLFPSSANSTEVSAMPTAALLPGPAILRAAPGSTWVHLTWSTVGGASRYLLRRGTTPGGPYNLLVETSTATYDDVGLTNASHYYYVASPVDGNGEGGYSPEAVGDPSVLRAPKAPEVTVTSAYNGQIDLAWPNAPGATSYTVQRASTSGGPYSTLTGSRSPFHDTTVSDGRIYFYLVTANASNGLSATSPEIPAMSTTATADPPTQVVAHPGNPGITLTWDIVPGATSYVVSWANASGGPYTAGSVQNLTSPEYTLTTAAATPLYFVVDSVVDGTTSDHSAEVPAMASALLLPTPMGLAAVAGNGTVDLTWSAATGAGAYVIHRRTDAESWQQIASTTHTGYADTTVVNGVRYHFAVASAAGSIEAAWSTVVDATPSALYPLPPANVQTRSGNPSLTATWNADPIATSYTVRWGSSAGGPYTSSATGLTTPVYTLPVGNSTPLYFVVQTVVAGLGASAYSNEAPATASTTRPGSASNLVAVSGNGVIDLAWTAGANATSYNIYRTDGAHSFEPVGSTPSTGYQDTTALEGQTYSYAVAASSAGVEVAWSNVVSATALETYPYPPEDVAAHAGSAGITITWTPEPAAATYTVRWGTSSGGTYTTGQAQNLTSPIYTLNTALTTPLYFVVQAVNAARAASGYSAEVTGTVRATNPATPTGLAAVTGDGVTNLTWGAVGGATGYAIYRRVGGEGWRHLGDSTVTGYRDLTPPNGVVCHYGVAARNATAEGSFATVDATAVATDPMPPADLTAYPGPAGVTLTWTAVPGASSYTVAWGTSAGGPYNGGSARNLANTTYTLRSTATTPLHFVVQTAVGSAVSAYSDEVTATVDPRAPAAPRTLTATPHVASIDLSWTAVTGARVYDVFRTTAADARWVLIARTPATRLTDPGLTSGTLYRYAVAVHGLSGTSAWSSVATATPN